MEWIATDDPRAVAVVDAIHRGDVDALRRLLDRHPEVATARLGDEPVEVFDEAAVSRTVLHVVTDWPGHFPRGADTVKLLAERGADVDARFSGSHNETPLHWAASSDDVSVLDALLDAGADIEAPGAVIAGDTPLMDAVAFGQWHAARRLVERGARTSLWQAAALGLTERVDDYLADEPPPGADEIDSAFWAACHGGQLAVAERLHEHGADVDFLPTWERCTPLDAARRSEAFDVITWLQSRGAKSAERLPPDE